MRPPSLWKVRTFSSFLLFILLFQVPLSSSFSFSHPYPDDLEISVDFFDYFIGLYPILRADPSLYCISSWNDNGMDEVVRDPEAVHRTEVFPGMNEDERVRG